jgi:hypothetical protein
MSADGLRVGLERQIAKWRQTAIEERARAEVLRSPKIDFQYPQGALVLSRAYCLEQLANELAALLHAHPPDPTVVTGVFCDYMIGVNPCLLVSGHAGPHIMQFPDESAQNPPALLPPEDDQP